MTGCTVSHISAVTKLDAGLCAFSVDSGSKFAQCRKAFLAHIYLSVERNAGNIYSAVSHGCHSDTTACYANVVVHQFFCWHVVTCHVLESRRADEAVTESNGTQLVGSEKFIRFHMFNFLR